MVTPWSTNAVEITQNMDITGIIRIERFDSKKIYPLIQCFLAFHGLDQSIFKIHITLDPIIQISDIDAYNREQGLALSTDEVDTSSVKNWTKVN